MNSPQVTLKKMDHFKYLTDSAKGKNRSQVSSVIPLTGCTVSWKDNHLARIAGSLWLKTTCQRINDMSIGRWRITAWGFDPGRTDEARPNLKKECMEKWGKLHQIDLHALWNIKVSDAIPVLKHKGILSNFEYSRPLHPPPNTIYPVLGYPYER